MATYEGLSADQRATLDLLISKGRSYEQLADALHADTGRIRSRALDALTALAPVSAAAVDDEDRELLTDYLLNQQTPSEAVSARGRLRRSEAARAWSQSVLDSLEHLYPAGTLPVIPAAVAADEPAPRRKSETGGRTLDPQVRAIVRRRRLIGAVAGALLLALIVFVWPIGVLGGGDDDSATADSDADPVLVGQLQLRPTTKAGRDRGDAGIALVSQTGDKLEVAIEAKIPASTRKDAYQVWLYNSRNEVHLLGAQVANAQGSFIGRAPLPENYRDFRFLDISREQIQGEEGHSGKSVLRGQLNQLDDPVEVPDGDSDDTTTAP